MTIFINDNRSFHISFYKLHRFFKHLNNSSIKTLAINKSFAIMSCQAYFITIYNHCCYTHLREIALRVIANQHQTCYCWLIVFYHSLKV